MRTPDPIGQRFGKLTVIGSAPDKGRYRYVRCRCDCGNETVVRLINLKDGHTQSCGHCVTILKEGDHLRYVCKSGKSFIFDEEDLPLVAKRKWRITPSNYVISSVGRGKYISLHRYLLGFPNEIIDHANCGPTDNRRKNLRVATKSQNTHNKGLLKTNTTGYKGVCFSKCCNKYIAYINHDGLRKHLGTFEDPIEAALAYDRAAFLYYGEFAKPNFARKES